MVSGAMAPDYLYFIQLSHSSRFGHTLRGAFLFSLPAGLIALWLYHRLLAKPLLSLAPDFVARRVAPQDLRFPFGPPLRFAWLALSVLVGVFSHIIWDAFTHERGLFVTMVPDLKLYFGLDMPVYAFLQLASSVVGAVLLAGAFYLWYRRAPLRDSRIVPALQMSTRILVILAAAVADVAFAVSYGFHQAEMFPAKVWWSVFIAKTVIGSISAFFLELIVFSLAWYALTKNKAPEPKLEGSTEAEF